jgi:hypothetical protein
MAPTISAEPATNPHMPAIAHCGIIVYQFIYPFIVFKRNSVAICLNQLVFKLNGTTLQFGDEFRKLQFFGE